jgi:hypothetical protein
MLPEKKGFSCFANKMIFGLLKNNGRFAACGSRNGYIRFSVRWEIPPPPSKIVPQFSRGEEIE